MSGDVEFIAISLLVIVRQIKGVSYFALMVGGYHLVCV
jgi:hypothetical protein